MPTIEPTVVLALPAPATPTKAASPDADALRRQRGLAIAAVTKIEQKKEGFWTVPSQTGNGKYWVRMTGESPTCTCLDFEKRNAPCKHVFAVQYVIERESHPDGAETVTETEIVTETAIVTETDPYKEAVEVTRKTTATRKTYKQVWPAYNKAQATEKHRFQVILAELCRGIVEPERKPSRGMQPLRLADAVFSAVFKVYSTVSGRRFSCDVSDAFDKGYMARLPHYNTVFTYLENPNLTPILRALIIESAKPLKAVEVDFAVDSSGFTSCRFVKWFDHKYGVPRQKHDWVKVSVMTGVRTNIVTAVEVDPRYSGDCPQFSTLVKKTAESFDLREVSADAAYLSYENMDVVNENGGTPFILFRSDTTAVRGGVFEKMFHLYNLNRDDYLSHYHKRSNVESTFSMMKAKFGDHLRSKTDTAMANEALAKVLCHNICCLIQSMYELGVNPVFWGEEEDEDGSAEGGAGDDAAPSTDELIDMFAWI
jgi:transposase